MINSSFNRIDRVIHLVLIPVFSILAALFIKDNDEIDHFHPIWRVLEPLIWVLFIWICNRTMILQVRKWLGTRISFTRRLLVQISGGLLIGVAAIIGSAILHSTLIEPGKTILECIIWSQRITLPILIFSVFENAIYESFFLFQGLAQSQLESERYRQESLEARFQNLKNQLNPHFMFNSFNTLASIIEEDPKVAVDFVQELSTTYRYVLTSQKRDWVQLSDELAMIHSFLYLLQKRHEKGLEVEIDVSDELAKRWLPPLSVQMLVENAMKHNEASPDRPLCIRITAHGDYLTVENNRNPRKVVDSNGIGLSNILSRYRYLADQKVVVHDETDRFAVELPLMELVAS